MARSFFPYADYIITLIATYTLVSMSLISRPFGAIFFAKKIPILGAKKSLCISFIGVGLSTFLMSIIPSFYEICYYAPVGLGLLRIIQSFFAAGENSIAPLYIQNYFKNDKQIKSSSIFSSSTMLGIFISSLVSSLIAMDFDHSYNELWRLPFNMGLITVALGLLMFRYGKDVEVNINFTTNIFSTIKKSWKKFLSIIFASGFCYHTNSMAFVFLNSYVPKVTKISMAHMMSINTGLLILDIILLPIIGGLVEGFNRRKVLTSSVLIYCIITCIFYYYLPLTDSFIYVTFMRMLMAVVGLLFLTTFFVWMKSECKPEEKYAIGGLGYAIGTELFGRTTPVINFWIWKYFNEDVFAPSLYTIFICLISMLGLWVLSTSDRELQ